MLAKRNRHKNVGLGVTHAPGFLQIGRRRPTAESGVIFLRPSGAARCLASDPRLARLAPGGLYSGAALRLHSKFPQAPESLPSTQAFLRVNSNVLYCVLNSYHQIKPMAAFVLGWMLNHRRLWAGDTPDDLQQFK